VRTGAVVAVAIRAVPVFDGPPAAEIAWSTTLFMPLAVVSLRHGNALNLRSDAGAAGTRLLPPMRAAR